ncbi:MAG TPA: PQQ-binding-like beta-propeller repeat protein [Planctomycetaceae bacterium]|nr:PQQ-binding-like beta-propeller repeat protein [Planctomycetaceae bacterium]
MLRRSFPLLAVFVLSQSFAQAADETRRFAVADSSKGRIAIVGEDGKTEWEYKIGPLHDLHVLENGHLLFQTNWTRIVEVDPATDKIVWEYEAKQSPGNDGRKVEVHAFQRLADGNTMIVESGAARILEVDARGELKKEIKLQVAKPHAHHDTRLVRKLDSGNYLVCHEADGRVKEYDASGKVVWDYEVPLFGKSSKPGHGVDAFGNQCFSALRLENGNTLIGTGNGHSVIEVTPDKKIVWKLDQNDLPEIQFAWVTSLQVLPNGNLLIGNCHAGPENPQLVEITRDKKVVWTFRDFVRLGDATTNSQILSVNGKQLESSIR